MASIATVMSAIGSPVASRVLLGLLLIEMGVISEDQLEHALSLQRSGTQLLGEVLVACGYTSRLIIQEALAKQAGLMLEPEQGYGTGLRAKLVDEEQRREPRVTDIPVEPVEPVVAGGENHRIEQLERGLAAAVSRHVELEARLDEREERIGKLQSDLDAIRRDLAGLPHRATLADPQRHDDHPHAFLAVVGRAHRHLAVRRAQIDTQEQRRARDLGRPTRRA